jgi:hypothetical protein
MISMTGWPAPALDACNRIAAIGAVDALCPWNYSQVVAGFPTSATVPNAPTQTATVDADSVIEMSSANDALLNNWSLFNTLDPVRVTYLTFAAPSSLGVDWGHANAVIEDPRRRIGITSQRVTCVWSRHARTPPKHSQTARVRLPMPNVES